MNLGIFFSIMMLSLATFNYSKALKSNEFQKRPVYMKIAFYLLNIGLPIALAFGSFYHSNPF